MGPYKGDFPLNHAVPLVFMFPTYKNSTGESITLSNMALADIKVYKNGSATERASTSGFALLGTSGADFDSLVGMNGFTIDLSDTTGGFYVTASEYDVVLGPITVDGQAVYHHAGSFSIENRSSLRPTVKGRTINITVAGEAALDYGTATVPDGANEALGLSDRGTAQAGSTSTTLVIRAAAAFADNILRGCQAAIVSGTGAGQIRRVVSNVGSTDTLTIEPAWTTTPDNTSVYNIRQIGTGVDLANVSVLLGPYPWLNIAESGTMQAGSTASTAVLRAATSFANDLIDGGTIVIYEGTGAGESSNIWDWDSATDTASVDPDWTVTPDNTSKYYVVPTPAAPIAQLPDVNISSTSLEAINAQMVDVMSVDAHAEPAQGAPAATISYGDKINYIYEFLRNKQTFNKTTGESIIYADNGTTANHKATVTDDGTTMTRGEYGTGA